jgi:exopolysaccharide biosynthesis protein
LTRSSVHSSPFRAAIVSIAALVLAGCPTAPRGKITVTEGVTFWEDSAANAQLLVVDRRQARVRTVVVAGSVARIGNNAVGAAKTVRAWAEQYGALAGVNGGFFGDSYDSLGQRKQLVQLCVVEGKVVAEGFPIRGGLRSSIGFYSDGRIEAPWATGSEKSGARAFRGPQRSGVGKPWRPDSAVAGGPRLIHQGKIDITDRRERLGTDLPVARVAIAFSDQYLVFCRVDAMRYQELARYLVTVFKETLHESPDEALCLDGGPSAQLVFSDSGRLIELQPTGVQVPTAVLLLPRAP